MSITCATINLFYKPVDFLVLILYCTRNRISSLCIFIFTHLFELLYSDLSIFGLGKLVTKELEQNFKNLTWNELQNLAGSRTLKRGEDYYKSGRVTNLRITPKGILANVSGTNEYITLVTLEKQGRQKEIVSECTCPVGSNCKHAVATILAFSQNIKNKTNRPIADLHDPDIESLKGFVSEAKDTEDDEDIAFPDVSSQQKKLSGKSTPERDIVEFLDKQDKESLKELIMRLAKSHPDVRTELLDSSRLTSGKVDNLVSSISREIANITSEPAWENHWSGEGNLSDFSRVKSTMSNLFDRGYYKEVIDITRELLEKGNSYVEECHDEGDAALQISECMEIGFKAVGKCGWSNLKKIMFAIEAALSDEYDICNGNSELLESIHDKSAWSEAADELFKRLNNLPLSNNQSDDFTHKYERDLLTKYIISALEKSGRDEEILPLCEKEARITGSWDRYVDRLIQRKKYTEARKVAEEGIRHIGQKYPGIASTLREKIAKLAEKEGDYNSIVVLRQEEFLARPCLENYEELLKAAKNTGNKTEIRAWALKYLETGMANNQGDQTSPQKTKEQHFTHFPMYHILIDIAEKEKDADLALYWYNQTSKKYNIFFDGHAQVARTIASKYPDEALRIWRALAEHQIAQTKPSAYETAIKHLQYVRDIYTKTNRKKEWDAYLAVLSEAHKKKTRFIQSLRVLTGEKI